MSIDNLLKDVDVVPILFMFGLLAVIIIIYNRYLYSKEKDRRETDLAQPSKFSKARIVSKEIANNNVYCHLIFELKNGERKRFTVQKNQASLFFENDSGMLEYKGDTFVAFMRGKNNDD